MSQIPAEHKSTNLHTVRHLIPFSCSYYRSTLPTLIFESSSLFIAVIITLLLLNLIPIFFCVFKQSRIVFTPIFVILLSLLTKTGIALFFVKTLGQFSLSPFDEGQYIITFEYADKLAFLWLLFLLPSAPLIFYIYGKTKLHLNNTFLDTPIKSFNPYFLAFRKPSSYPLVSRSTYSLFVLIIASFTLFFAFCAFSAGIYDRGSLYISNATNSQYRLFSILLSLTRIRDIFFFSFPHILFRANLPLRLLSIFSFVITLSQGAISGSRGEFLYPILLALLGFFTLLNISIRSILSLSSALLILLASAPILEAVRDHPRFSSTSITDIPNRLSVIWSIIPHSKERILYRAPQIGRQLYACSDPFLFLPRNSQYLSHGFNDLNQILQSAIPRIFSKSNPHHTFNSPQLAQQLIGVDRPGWYPCITLPADLYRRLGYKAVFVGGLIFFSLIVFVHYLWCKLFFRTSLSVFHLLCILFPISYLRFPPLGTINEVIWTLSWDMPKYILFFWLLSKISRLFNPPRPPSVSS